MTSSHISFFIPRLNQGGAERVMVNLARGMHNTGRQVEIITLDSSNASFPLPEGLDHVVLRAGRLAGSIGALRRHLNRSRPGILLSALDDANVVALLAALWSGSNTLNLITVHNTFSTLKDSRSSIKMLATKYLSRLLYPKASAVVAVSEGVRRDVAKNFRIAKESVNVLPNAVLHEAVVGRASVARMDANSGAPTRLIAVGRFSPEKDYATMIRAFKIVSEKMDSHLTILGGGPRFSAILQLVEELGLQDRVSMPGFVENVYDYLQQSHIFLLSSVSEGLPTVIIEAMAVGLTVVSTDCESGPRYLLDDGRLGYLSAIRDVEQFAQNILKAKANPIERARLVKRSEMYLVDSATEKYLNLIDRL